MRFENMHEQYVSRCEESLAAAARHFQPGSQVSQAAEYALLGGGKRVRGVLALAVCDMLEGSPKAAADFAAAVEMMHAFSLVHDDLPCMDDDDLRRGRPATHIAYGEATALLAGDLLALQAFEVIAGADTGAGQVRIAVQVLAGAAGARGMIYGQELDLQYERQPAGEEELDLVQRHKTGALIRSAALMGAAVAGLTPVQAPAICEYAENLGRVFQIVDDILDVLGDVQTLGKPIGSDAQQGKTTTVSLYGIEAARVRAQNLTEVATTALGEAYGDRADFLCEYARRLLRRAY